MDKSFVAVLLVRSSIGSENREIATIDQHRHCQEARIVRDGCIFGMSPGFPVMHGLPIEEGVNYCERQNCCLIVDCIFRCLLNPLIINPIRSVDFKRSEYGVNYGLPGVGDDVELTVAVGGARK
jgi:hypothetical protein